MELHKKNSNHKIIGTDDIIISSDNSNLGNKLSDILNKQDQDILDLKQNVKWLYKYGGVGGSGNGGSGSSKLKANISISYTNTAGDVVQDKLKTGSSFNVKPGNKVIITASITSVKSLPEYNFSITNLNHPETPIKTTIKATDVNGVITLYPNENAKYSIAIIGETTISLDFSMYTQVINTDSGIKSGVFIIKTGSSIYSSQLDENTEYYFNLTNCRPSEFVSSINSITINGVNVNKENIEFEEFIDNKTGYKHHSAKIKISKYFESFDIYDIQVNYTFGNDSLNATDQFIFQSDSAFVYCFSDITQVSNKDSIDLQSSNAYNIVIKYKIYKGQNDDFNKQYQVKVNTLGTTVSVTAKTGDVKTYSISNNVTEQTKIPITFTVDGNEFIYYISLTPPEELPYIFKRGGEGENKDEYCYQAVMCNTNELNNAIMEFPEPDPTKNGTINITKEVTYPLKKITEQFVDFPKQQNYIVSELINYTGTIYPALRPDGLFSFGIKYEGFDHSLPILKINSSNNSSIVLYKNSLEFGNSRTDRICIPNDNKFHLVQLYFKSDYSTSEVKLGEEYKQVVCIFIDGVLEVAPFEISGFFINANSTSITYCPGLWQYNHIGVATFNGKPSSIVTFDDGVNITAISRYLYDIDPIIPANYYQTYCIKNLDHTLNQKFDKSIYSAFDRDINGSPQWINCFTYGDRNNDKIKYFDKFIRLSPADIKSLIPENMEVYCIAPESTNLSGENTGFNPTESGINQFLYNTTTSYGENSLIGKISCNIQKFNKQSQSFDNLINDDRVTYYVKYQGSSTLLYSAKNFEIGTNPVTDDEGVPRDIFFSPDINTFPFLEKSFNIKADLVDSSHSNNVIISNFVNDYTNSPFGNGNENYKSCLTGKPILLFMQNNYIDENEKVIDNSYVFLGIYSLNLNRGSTNSLGYTKLIKSSGETITTTDNVTLDSGCCDTITKYHVMSSTDEQIPTNKFAVAEVQGNGLLYDYSQYDAALLANQILGDFYTSETGLKTTENWLNDLQKPFVSLAKIINKYFLTETEDALGNTSKSIFNRQDYSFLNQYKESSDFSKYYYYDGVAPILTLTNVPENGLVIKKNTLENLSPNETPYKHYDENNIVFINNPLVQFHLICDGNGNVIEEDGIRYYYVQNISDSILNFETIEDLPAVVDVESIVKYYVVCMAFAMVDSVQKNLTLKCPNLNDKQWYLGFYDMDTAFGLTNSGGTTNFQAFSDYVLSSGKIIQDYSPEGESGLYDTPSSFLFLYAKYIDLITGFEFSGNQTGMFPFQEWKKLRTKVENFDKSTMIGAFESGTKFCENYIDNFFGEINPLIWNLNYMYKYFSRTNNTNSSDTESSRFNGTRKHSRKEFLEKRFQYLDVMFGFNNPKRIGSSNIKITGDNSDIPNNPNIKIADTMFPQFTKGFIGNINAIVTDIPKTPIVLKTSIDNSLLYLTDDKGEATITGNVTSNTDVGFYGTTSLLSVSECGQFLAKNDASEAVIKNNYISKININKFPSKINLKLEISNDDTQNLISLNNIELNISDKRYNKIDNLTITYNGTVNKSIDLIKLNNIECNKIIIKSENDGILQIGTLEIKNSIIATDLELSSLIIDNVIIENNQIKSMVSLQSINTPTLKIPCISTKTFSITNSNIETLKLTSTGNLESITIGNSDLTLFEVDVCSRLNTFTIGKEVKCEKISLLQNGLIEAIHIPLTNNNLTLCLNNFSSLKTLTFSDNITNVSLSEKAFYNCKSLNSIPKLTNKYNILGPYVFLKCSQLNNELLQNVKFEESVNLTGMYAGTNVNNEFVRDFFKQENRFSGQNLTNMFVGCKNILGAVETKDDDGNSIITPNEYYDDTINYIYENRDKISGISGIFYQSGFNLMTQKFAECIAHIEQYKYDHILGGNLTSESENSSVHSNGMLYFEKETLGKFKTISLSGNTKVSGFGYTFYQQKFIEVIDEKLKIIKSVTMPKIFGENNKTVQTIYWFRPYSENDYSIDFEKGLPKTVTEIGIYQLYSAYNLINLEHIFDNCTTPPILREGSFAQILNDEYPVNLYEFLIKENDENGKTPKVILKYTDDEAKAVNSYFYFKKHITSEEQFYSILDLIKQPTATNDTKYANMKKNISWIFSNCTITCSDPNNILKSKLLEFDKAVGAFKDCKFVDAKQKELHVDINYAFGDSESDSEPVCNYTFTSLMFENCKLLPLTKQLNLWVTVDAQNMFKNAIYQYSTTDSQQMNDDIEHFQSLIVYEGQQILPDGFFESFKSECIVNGLFSRDTFSTMALKGHFPETDKLGYGNIQTIKSVFENSNITYRKVPKSNPNEGFDYILFPNWYASKSGTNRFKVYIPFGNLLGQGNLTDQETWDLYLFDDMNNYSGTYDSLPSFPPEYETYSGFTYKAIKDCNDIIPYKISRSNDVFKGTGENYTDMIPYPLSICLDVGFSSKIIEDLANSHNTVNIVQNDGDFELGKDTARWHAFGGDGTETTFNQIVNEAVRNKIFKK